MIAHMLILALGSLKYGRHALNRGSSGSGDEGPWRYEEGGGERTLDEAFLSNSGSFSGEMKLGYS